MKIHEYQAKELFRSHNIPVPDGKLCYQPEEAQRAAEEFGLPVAVKAQVHAGGRGKGGGVRVARSIDEALEAATAILGMSLVTQQTGAGMNTHYLGEVLDINFSAIEFKYFNIWNPYPKLL